MTLPLLYLSLSVWPLLSAFHIHLCNPASDSICLGLPRAFFRSIFPSITVLSSESFLSACPIHFLCIFPIVYIRALSAPIHASASSFVICSHSIISIFIICFLRFLFSFPLRSSLLFQSVSFPIAILLLISLQCHLTSVVIILPR